MSTESSASALTVRLSPWLNSQHQGHPAKKKYYSYSYIWHFCFVAGRFTVCDVQPLWLGGGCAGGVRKTLNLTFTLSKESLNTVYLFLYKIHLKNVPFQVVIISTCCRSSKGQIAFTSTRHQHTSEVFNKLQFNSKPKDIKQDGQPHILETAFTQMYCLSHFDMVRVGWWAHKVLPAII